LDDDVENLLDLAPPLELGESSEVYAV